MDLVWQNRETPPHETFLGDGRSLLPCNDPSSSVRHEQSCFVSLYTVRVDPRRQGSKGLLFRDETPTRKKPWSYLCRFGLTNRRSELRPGWNGWVDVKKGLILLSFKWRLRRRTLVSRWNGLKVLCVNPKGFPITTVWPCVIHKLYERFWKLLRSKYIGRSELGVWLENLSYNNLKYLLLFQVSQFT